jgi:excisionase family DNA binding protein
LSVCKGSGARRRRSKKAPPRDPAVSDPAAADAPADGIRLEPATGLGTEPLRPAFLSVKQFAVVVGLSENTVLRRIKDKQIAATRIGRLWRIPVTEVGRLLG